MSLGGNLEIWLMNKPSKLPFISNIIICKKIFTEFPKGKVGDIVNIKTDRTQDFAIFCNIL